SRLVETDVPRLADAEQLKIDPTGGANRLFVRGAGLRHPLARRRTFGDVHVLLRDVHVREEVLPHVAVIAVTRVRRHRVVLVQIERDDAGKIDVPRLVAADQLLVDAKRSAAGGEAEHGPAFGAGFALNDFDDAVRDRDGEIAVLGEHHRAQPLALTRALDGRRENAAFGGFRHYTFTSIVAPRLWRTYRNAIGTINKPAAMIVRASRTAERRTACCEALAAWKMAESCLASSTIIASRAS